MLSRLQADALLLLVAFIWGTAFVAQKGGAMAMGPFTFVAARFLLSTLFVLPLAWRERVKSVSTTMPRRSVFMLCATFAIAAILQQAGMAYTTVVNASFITSLYVIAVPALGFLIYRMPVSMAIYPAALLSCYGVYLLSGGGISLGMGDILVFLCAIGFGLHILLMGRLMSAWPRPFAVCFFQYLFLTLIASTLCFILETPSWDTIWSARYSILYIGILSGGVAYTLQAVAQRFTPSADAAIILGGEALFGALAGIWLLNENMTPVMWTGGGMILLSILVVELLPLIKAARGKFRKA